MTKYDVIIIGGGVAGWTAALFTARRGLHTLVISKDLGGQTSSTLEVENYPGLGRIEGPDLIQRFYQDARAGGVEALFIGVRTILKLDDGFLIKTENEGAFFGEAVILACGKTPRQLGCEGEKEFQGKGIVYSSFKNPEEWKGKILAVIGGGSSSLQAATSLDAFAQKIYLIHRRDEFRGEAVLIDRLKKSVHIEKKLNRIPLAFTGTDSLQSLTLKNILTGEEEVLDIDGVCIAAGFELQTQFLADLIQCDDEGKIRITTRNETNCQGIFAAGDVTAIPYQQIVISAGEGAKAAISAYQYLYQKRGKRPLRVDWGYRNN